jgi:bleomycin hydrolase
VLTGADIVLDKYGVQKVTKWKVENSWGPDAGNHGFNVMTDAWFSEFVYQVVIDASQIPGVLGGRVKEAMRQETIVLPLWDPLGSLA